MAGERGIDPALLDNNLIEKSIYLSVNGAKGLKNIINNKNKDEHLIVEHLMLNADLSAKTYNEILNNPSNNLSKDNEDVNLLHLFPNYSVADYFKDIDKWKKQLNPFVTKGHFYFKIFFNFDTNYGLLGGILNHNKSTNTAYAYLSLCENMGLYKSQLISNRKNSLFKFVNTLSNISINNPWFFKSINGLNNIKGSYVNAEDFSDNTIEIQCSEESIDMRLGTLFDLYKYSCYDNIRNKEIIPANLRKFEMQILFCHVPFKKYQQEFTSNENKEYNDKSTNYIDVDPSDIMSFKLFTFQNCEFDVNSLNEFNDSPSNENLFNLGNNQIRIKYDKVFETRLNEYEHIIVGQDGLYTFDDNGRFESIAANINDSYESYYIEAHDRRGNSNQNLYENHTKIKSKYYQEKLKYSKLGTIKKGNIYHYDFIRTGRGKDRINTKYFEEKLRRLSEGTIGGNLYDYDYMRTGYNLKHRQNTDYLNYKLLEIKLGTIKGNMYAYNYATFIKRGKKVNTAYLEEKLRRLSKGTINGNLYDYNFGPESKYFSKKLERISNGSINGNLYDYNFGPLTDYFEEKLNRIKNGSLNTTLSDIPLSLAFENQFKESNITTYDKDMPWKFEIPRDMSDLNEFNETNIEYKEIDEDLAHVSLFTKKNNIGSATSARSASPKNKPIPNQFKENNIETKQLDYSLAKSNSFTLDWHANAMMNSNNIYATEGADIKSHTWVGKLLEGTFKRSLAGLGF